MDNAILTRYLYFLDEAKYSLIHSLIKKTSFDEVVYWVGEIYYSGFVSDLWEILWDYYYRYLSIKFPKYEKILRFERETNVRLRGEAGIVKKKLQAVLKDTDEHKTNMQKMTLENQKLHSSIRNLEKDITDLKTEIRTRDDAIGEKEKRTTDLKRNAVELDKNR